MEVQFSGMELDSDQKSILNGYSDKFCKGCDVKALHINLKGHKKAGGRMSYTTQLRAEIRGKGKKTVEKTAEDTDWDFNISVKNAFFRLQKEIKVRKKGFFRRIWARKGDTL